MSTKTERKARMTALETSVREALHDLSTCEALTDIDGYTQRLMDLAYEASEVEGDPEFTDEQADRANALADALHNAAEAAEGMSDLYTEAHMALSAVVK